MDPSSFTNQRPRKRQRRTAGSAVSCTFEELREHWNYVVDVEDILEDFRETGHPRHRKPLALNTEDGDWDEIPEYDHKSTIYKPKMCVGLRNGTFLRIRTILMEFDHNHVVFRGDHLVRTSRLRPILGGVNNTRHNELFLNIEGDKVSNLPMEYRSMVDVPVQLIDGEVNIHFTNGQSAETDAPWEYFCRWKLIRLYVNIKSGRKAVEAVIERLRFVDADAAHGISDDVLRYAWRGPTIAGGSNDGHYTAVDGFCCGGGWSRGATMAGGINVVRSFDMDPKACATYKANFPSTHCLNLSVFEYCSLNRPEQITKDFTGQPSYVDISHFSTPCQIHSPAHTREGQNDEQNFASSFCISDLLMKDRPRVTTFENTSGLQSHHFKILQAIFGQLTSLDYSIRFSCLNFKDFGVPQDRLRLVLIGSCPGERLPTFPSPTHSEAGQLPGTIPWVTVREAIKCIPSEGWQNHQPKQMKKKTLPLRERDFATTMTTGENAGEVHHEGRAYTIAECQVIQGFPLHHRFAQGLSRTQIRAQIGNAFPSMFVKKLLRHIRRQMQTADGVPISIDRDEFMSSEELKELEVAEFLREHEQLPEGTRANITWDEDEDEDEDEDADRGEEKTAHAKEADREVKEDEESLFVLDDSEYGQGINGASPRDAGSSTGLRNQLDWSWSMAMSTPNSRRSSGQSVRSPDHSSQSSLATSTAIYGELHIEGSSKDNPIEL